MSTLYSSSSGLMRRKRFSLCSAASSGDSTIAFSVLQLLGRTTMVGVRLLSWDCDLNASIRRGVATMAITQIATPQRMRLSATLWLSMRSSM